jgi:hypothetical protein
MLMMQWPAYVPHHAPKFPAIQSASVKVTTRSDLNTHTAIR